MDYLELKEAILHVLDRRRCDLGDVLQQFKNPIDLDYSYGFIDGYRKGYLSLLEDLENLVKYDQLD